MSIVKVTAPAQSGRVSYGVLGLNFGPGGSDGVPAYLAKNLVAKGFTCDQDVSKVDLKTELGKAPENELGYFLGGHGLCVVIDGEVLADKQARAVEAFINSGEPT